MRIFQSYGDITIANEGLQTYARHTWPLSSEGSLACHTYCDMEHPFIMVISEDQWHSHVLPSVWQWSCHYLFLWLRSVAAGINTTNLPPARQMLATATVIKDNDLKGLRLSYLSHLGKGWVLHLNKLEFDSPKDALYQFRLWLTQWFCRRSFFKFRQCFYAISQLPPTGKGQGHSFEQNWVLITKACFVPSLVENWPAGSWDLRRFLNFVNGISQFHYMYYFLLEKDGIFLLKKFESPLTKDVLCQVWLTLVQWF